MKIKILLLLLLPVLLMAQTPTGFRQAWIDTIWISHDAAWVDIQDLIGDSVQAISYDSVITYGYHVPIWQNSTIADSAAGDTALGLFGGNQWHTTSNKTWETKLDLYYNVNKKLYGIYFWYDANNAGTSIGWVRIWVGSSTAIDTATYPISTTWGYSENGCQVLAYTDGDAGTLPTSTYTYRIRIQITTSDIDGNFFVRPYALEAIYYLNRVGDF